MNPQLSDLSYHNFGQASIMIEQTPVSGHIYSVEGKQYLLIEEIPEFIIDSSNIDFLGQVYELSKQKFVSDKILIAEVWALQERDNLIGQTRQQKAHELAAGDPVLEEIIFWNMEYRNGDLDQPELKQGIVFYPVGHNSSHYFFAGVKNGQRFRRSVDCDVRINDDYITPVTNWNGYYGHY